jgi:hypothetical protein
VTARISHSARQHRFDSVPFVVRQFVPSVHFEASLPMPNSVEQPAVAYSNAKNPAR